MQNGRQTRASERRVVTALFCDVVGSTSLAETMDPEDWAEIVNEVVAGMVVCIERYGGTVAQFAGDSILAIFGAPAAHEDDPYRAVRAGLDIIANVGRGSDYAVDISVRAGIHTGLVVVGDLTAGDLNVYAALGDTTNVAARIQALAEPGSLLVSEDTHRLVANDVVVRELGPVEMKGKKEPVAVFEIRDARDVSSRRRGIPGFESPMVGRAAELAQLVEMVGYSQAGSGRVGVIVGDPGVGKSRLVAELHDVVVGIGGARWVLGRCAAYDQHRPYHLAASIVLALAGVTESDDPEVISKALEDIAQPAFGEDSASLGHLLQLLGLADGHPDDDPDVLHKQYDQALFHLLSATAAVSNPLVLVCEDVHWADASSAELLAGLLERIRQTTTTLIIVTRPERQSHGWEMVVTRAERELGEAFVESKLQPLDDRESRQLVANLLEIESLPADVRALVLSRTEGNPFFIEEVVRMLVDRGLIEKQGDRWVASAEISTLDVPETLHGLLASRIDSLPAEVRRVARIAAVIGRRFEARLLNAVLSKTGEDPVPAELNTLEARGVVKLVAVQPELAFSFRHALIHDVAYESILRKERRSLHAQVGAALAVLYNDRLEEHAPTLARHYEEAGDHDEAVRYLVMAGGTARARHAMPESHRFYSRALELIETDPDSPAGQRIDVALSMAAAGMRFVPGLETLAALDAVRAEAEQIGDPDVLARVYALSLEVRAMMEESYADPGFRETMDRAYALAPRVHQPDLRAFLEGMMGQALRSADEYAKAAQLVGGSVGPLEEAGRVGEAGFNAALTADVEASRGRFAEADRWIRHACELAEESGNPNVIADVELMRGRIAAARGELETALAHTQLGTETAEGAGNIECTLVGNFLIADQHLRSGDAAAAIPYLERTFELGEYCNAEAMVGLGQAWLATAKARLGELNADDYSRPLEMAQAGGSRSGEAAVRLQRAIAVAGEPSSSWKQVVADFERAIELFESIDARPDQARAIHAYANALEAAGRHEESQVQLNTAMEMFGAMGISPDG
ncbi:MAG: adenylate/guanylate cyclase domain-containing protein [Acidimicrobiia bacterium]|nr:adenylate/guanylate cyclase domain-containing protein [Acidimicrobiia bacterium]